MAKPPSPRALGRFAASVAVAITLVVAASLGAGVVTALAVGHDVSIADRAYSPAELTVAVGDPVTWTNGDGVSHTVTSDAGSELDSSTLGSGEAFGHVFEAAGTFPYHCEIHASMHGVVTVVAAAPSPSGSAAPTPPSGTLPPGFSPASSTGPDATASAGTETPTPSASAGPGLETPVPSANDAGSGGGPGQALLAVAVIVAAIVIAAVVAARLRRAR